MAAGAEQRALILGAVLIGLGVAVRVVRVVRAAPTPTPAAVAALDAQIARVDSARRAGRQPASRSPAGSRRGPASARRDPPAEPGPAAQRSPVDLDVASMEDIERLPWVGPVLAQRIVANREKCGPFGSLEAVKRVFGVGDGVARRLAPHVTFSAFSSPTGAASAPGCSRADNRAALPRPRR
jgi:competence protein ComEA